MNHDTALKSIHLSGSAPGPHLLITGGVHGDEFESMVAIRRLVSELRRLQGGGDLAGAVTCVPVVNEPAYERGSRTAEDALDLARVCPGRSDGSITERVAHAVSGLIRDADCYIDLHTGGTSFQVLPLVGYTLHADEDLRERQRQMARAFNLPVMWGTSPNLDGRTLSVARDADVPAIYAEYMGGGTCDPRGVQAYVDGCRGVMAQLGMVELPERASVVEHMVEDTRTGSGHMQVHNPAPISGYFEPAVELGTRVESGQPLGVVSDPLGHSPMTVPADASGVVLVLHTFPRVEKDDALAVILEVDALDVKHSTPGADEPGA